MTKRFVGVVVLVGIGAALSASVLAGQGPFAIGTSADQFTVSRAVYVLDDAERELIAREDVQTASFAASGTAIGDSPAAQ